MAPKAAICSVLTRRRKINQADARSLFYFKMTKGIAKGVSVYKQFYDDAAEREHGVLALRIKLSGTGPK